MKKILMATGTAVLFSNMAIAPAFANPLAQEIEPETQYQIVLPEGQMMTDAELAEVEGQIVWKPILIGAGISVGAHHLQCQVSRQQCNWQSYAIAGAAGAAGPLIPSANAARGVRFFQNGQRINGIRVFVR